MAEKVGCVNKERWVARGVSAGSYARPVQHKHATRGSHRRAGALHVRLWEGTSTRRCMPANHCRRRSRRSPYRSPRVVTPPAASSQTQRLSTQDPHRVQYVPAPNTACFHGPPAALAAERWSVHPRYVNCSSITPDANELLEPRPACSSRPPRCSHRGDIAKALSVYVRLSSRNGLISIHETPTEMHVCHARASRRGSRIHVGASSRTQIDDSNGTDVGNVDIDSTIFRMHAGKVSRDPYSLVKLMRFRRRSYGMSSRHPVLPLLC